MIKQTSGDLRHISWLLGKLRGSFEKKHADIAPFADQIRAAVGIYDRMLYDFFARPPKNGRETREFFDRHFRRLANFSPLIRKKIAAELSKLEKRFAFGPERTIRIGSAEAKFWLEDDIMIARNFLALYIGDPLRTEKNYKYQC